MYLVTELHDSINGCSSKLCIVNTLDEAWEQVKYGLVQSFLNGAKEYGTIDKVLAIIKEQNQDYSIESDDWGVQIVDDEDLEGRRKIVKIEPMQWMDL